MRVLRFTLQEASRELAALGCVPRWWYTRAVAVKNPRVQVTVDPELAEALGAIEPRPSSKSRLIRDMALRGARAMEEERRRREQAQEYLLRVARGEVDLDLDAVREVYKARGEHLP